MQSNRIFKKTGQLSVGLKCVSENKRIFLHLTLYSISKKRPSKKLRQIIVHWWEEVRTNEYFVRHLEGREEHELHKQTTSFPHFDYFIVITMAWRREFVQSSTVEPFESSVSIMCEFFVMFFERNVRGLTCVKVWSIPWLICDVNQMCLSFSFLMYTNLPLTMFSGPYLDMIKCCAKCCRSKV